MADFFLVGGDARQRHLARILRQAGHRVRGFGVDLLQQDALQDADVLWLPVPSFRGGRIHGEQGLLEAGKAQAWVPGRSVICYATAEQAAVLESLGPRALLNLAEDEEFLRGNAAISAEGALRAASGAGERALWRSRCLILGYGRIARRLAASLLRVGAHVTVCARSAAAREEARLAGARVCDGATLPDGADVCFNTVPARILELSTLQRLLGDGLYVELSSAPYGAEPESLSACGIRSLHLPGIPGQYYPATAAELLYEAMLRGWRAEILPLP